MADPLNSDISSGSLEGSDPNAVGQRSKKRKRGNEGESDVPFGTKRERILRQEAEWRRTHPACFAQKFVFFYSAFIARCYNAENAFLSQARRAKFTYIDHAKYVSAYHLYATEKARVIKSFRLRRTYIKMSGYFNAEDVVRMIKGHDGGVLEISDIKDVINEFEWTTEAELAWESKVRQVLYTANFYKFTRHPRLYRKLLDTGEKHLIKACNTACPCTCGIRFPFNEAMENRELWQDNLLGKTLMMVREDLNNLTSPLHKAHPTSERLATVRMVDQINDGRDHECETCRNFNRADMEV